MKNDWNKVKVTVMAVLVSLFLLFLATTPASALTEFGTANFSFIGNGTAKLSITYHEDTNGHTGYAVTIPVDYRGMVPFAVLHIPGSTTMTATADIEIRWYGLSIFGTGLHDCGGAGNSSSDFAIYAPLSNTGLTIYFTGNAVDNAVGTIEIYLR